MVGELYKTAFANAANFAPHNSSALGLFALSLKFDIDDVLSLRSDCLTEGGDDKKIDAIYLDTEDFETAVVLQAYKSQDENRPAAPANKASDLNTAVSWLITQPVDTLDSLLKQQVTELRAAICDKKIKTIEFWYVHNLPESANVERELRAVESSAKAALDQHFLGNELTVSALEVGNTRLEQWYRSLAAPILVNDKFEVDVLGGFEVSGTGWNAFSTYVTAKWLKEQFDRYQNDIFAPNIRGYLGSRKKDENINNGIKETCLKEPTQFWAYNNGITCIVLDYNVLKNGKLEITGLGIANGAQTTGAIGHSISEQLGAALVPTRFIKCSDSELINKIIRYNNSQNQITAADFRSNDRIQKRLRDEFETGIPNTRYRGRRGGAEDAISRPRNVIPSDTVAQALAAFHGDPVLAYNHRSEIWGNNTFYDSYFRDETTAKHIVLAVSLLRCIEEKKANLKKRAGDELTQTDKNQLEVLRKRGSTMLLVNAISNCMETFLERRVANPFRVSFGTIDLDDAVVLWRPIIEATIPFCETLVPALEDGLKNKEKVKETTATFRTLVESTKQPNRTIYTAFGRRILED